MANDLPTSNDLEVWPDSSVGRALTYNIRGRELESRSGRSFSRTFNFHIYWYNRKRLIAKIIKKANCRFCDIVNATKVEAYQNDMPLALHITHQQYYLFIYLTIPRSKNNFILDDGGKNLPNVFLYHEP